VIHARDRDARRPDKAWQTEYHKFCLRRYKPDVDKGRDTMQSIIQSTTDGQSVTTTKETKTMTLQEMFDVKILHHSLNFYGVKNEKK